MYTNGETREEVLTMESIQRIEQKIPELELRDIFAIHIANGLLSDPQTIVGTELEFAEICYQYADAFIQARR